jgi:hypothetical protein
MAKAFSNHHRRQPSIHTDHDSYRYSDDDQYFLAGIHISKLKNKVVSLPAGIISSEPGKLQTEMSIYCADQIK